MTSDEKHREVFRYVARMLVDFASDICKSSHGVLSPMDAASTLLAAGARAMSNVIGRAATASYMREAADRLERSDDTPTEWN